ncbi:MAG: hypothetical protein AB7H66_07670 [Hyphomonadaceae bacterium]
MIVQQRQIDERAGWATTLIAMGIAFLGVAFGWLVWNWVASDAQTDTADRVGVVIAAFGVVTAIGAMVVAGLTIRQQQIESKRQRQMETLHLVNEQYEKIFDDIYELRLRADGGSDVAEREKMRIYNRFFTTIMTGFRYYQLGFIPGEDFCEWTATLIGRFAKGECIVTGVSTPKDNPLLKRWEKFDSWARGPRTDFRRYMAGVTAEAKRIDPDAPQAALVAALQDASNKVVDGVRVST